MARDPYRYFRIEARELLEQIGKAVLDLEGSAAPAEPIARLLRLAHTLKGAARVVKQPAMADCAHELEGAIAPYREQAAVPRVLVDQALKLIDQMGEQLAQLPAEEPAKSAEGRPQASVKAAAAPEPARTVRTAVDDVDLLLRGFAEVRGELAVMRRAVADPALARSVERAERELNEMRVLTERLRLVPVGTLFNSLERLVRDSARAAGKLVEFESRGADVRMEGDVLDAVQPALMQLVRNAVAHGIEPESERRSAGKPAAGRVILEVARRAQRVVFRCHDDGRGVDLEGVEDVLRNKGALLVGERLGATDLLSLLLKGGLSTAKTVTDLSGRGIGLDVVREVAERLHADVSMDTAAGKGTTVQLGVPISLASFESLLVEAGGVVAAFPLDSIVGARRAQHDEVVQTDAGEAVAHDGRLVPLVGLAERLAAGGREQRAGNRGKRGAFTVVLVNAGEGLLGAVVDRLLGVETIVLRPIPALAPLAPIVAGLCLDADGDPLPVLAPEALAGPAAPVVADTDEKMPARPILVIDDSLTTRMLEQSILESAGYAVDLATSADEGLDMARRGEYGLILCDVEMPGMDGFTFIEHWRADSRLCAVPCMLVTSRSSSEDRRRAEAAGASGYIVKGEFNQALFLERVAQLVQQ